MDPKTTATIAGFPVWDGSRSQARHRMHETMACAEATTRLTGENVWVPWAWMRLADRYQAIAQGFED